MSQTAPQLGKFSWRPFTRRDLNALSKDAVLAELVEERNLRHELSAFSTAVVSADDLDTLGDAQAVHILRVLQRVTAATVDGFLEERRKRQAVEAAIVKSKRDEDEVEEKLHALKSELARAKKHNAALELLVKRRANSRPSWPCTECTKRFESKQFLEAHMMRRHPDAIEPKIPPVTKEDVHTELEAQLRDVNASLSHQLQLLAAKEAPGPSGPSSTEVQSLLEQRLANQQALLEKLFSDRIEAGLHETRELARKNAQLALDSEAKRALDAALKREEAMHQDNDALRRQLAQLQSTLETQQERWEHWRRRLEEKDVRASGLIINRDVEDDVSDAEIDPPEVPGGNSAHLNNRVAELEAEIEKLRQRPEVPQLAGLAVTQDPVAVPQMVNTLQFSDNDSHLSEPSAFNHLSARDSVAEVAPAGETPRVEQPLPEKEPEDEEPEQDAPALDDAVSAVEAEEKIEEQPEEQPEQLEEQLEEQLDDLDKEPSRRGSPAEPATPIAEPEPASPASEHSVLTDDSKMEDGVLQFRDSIQEEQLLWRERAKHGLTTLSQNERLSFSLHMAQHGTPQPSLLLRRSGEGPLRQGARAPAKPWESLEELYVPIVPAGDGPAKAPGSSARASPQPSPQPSRQPSPSNAQQAKPSSQPASRSASGRPSAQPASRVASKQASRQASPTNSIASGKPPLDPSKAALAQLGAPLGAARPLQQVTSAPNLQKNVASRQSSFARSAPMMEIEYSDDDEGDVIAELASKNAPSTPAGAPPEQGTPGAAALAAAPAAAPAAQATGSDAPPAVAQMEPSEHAAPAELPWDESPPRKNERKFSRPGPATSPERGDDSMVDDLLQLSPEQGL